MPRRISAEEAKRLGAVPVEAPRRRISVAEARRLGAVDVVAPASERSERSDESAMPVVISGLLAGPMGAAGAALGHALAKPDALAPETKLGAAGGGVLQGVTFGRSDELGGAVEVPLELGKRLGRSVGLLEPAGGDADPATNQNPATITKSWGPSSTAKVTPTAEMPPEEPSLATVYRRARDQFRAMDKRAEAAHPVLYKAGELAGSLAVPIPGSAPVKGATLGAKVLRGGKNAAILGAVIGEGKSEADLTKGDVGGVLKDAGTSAAIAAPLGAAGGLAQHGLSKLADRFGGRAGEIKAAKAAKDAEELLASRQGQYGQKVQDARRTLLNMKDTLADPNASPALKARTQKFLDSEEGRALVEQVGSNTLEEAPAKFNQMAELRALRDAAPSDAAKATEEYFAKSTLLEDVLPRAKNYALRAVPQFVGDAAGELLGGVKGVTAGVVGALSGAALGKPGTALGNLLQKTPRFNVALNRMLEAGSAELGQALGVAPQVWAAQTTADRRKALGDAGDDAGTVAKVESLLGGGNKLEKAFGSGR